MRSTSFEEAVNRDICDSFIKADFELDRLTAIAPKLYDDISFYAVPDTHCKALDLMGTRFSSITWTGGDPKEPATPELVNFLRRQLRSNYLRNLEVLNVKFEDRALDNEFVVFVTRPWFEWLDMENVSLRLPFEVIERAHKAWEAPKFCEFKQRVINAQISEETVVKLEDYFEMKFEFGIENENCELNIRHPEESAANFWFRVDDDYQISVHIYDL